MLQLAEQQTITTATTEVAVFKDDQQINKFYVLPQNPRFRIENNQPVFKLVKYRSSIEREDGPKGGLCIFDVELTISDAEREEIREKLLQQARKDADDKAKQIETLVLTYRQDKDNPQGEWRDLAREMGITPVQVRGLDSQYVGDRSVFKETVDEIEFGAISYTRGTILLNLQSLSNGLVERVISPSQPSLFGSNVATFTAELTPEGAALLEEVLTGKGSGIVSINYNLWFSAKLPPIEVKVAFDAEKFKSYSEEKEATIDTAWGTKQKETIEEQFRQSESGSVEVNILRTFADPAAEQALREELRQWGQQTLQDAIARQLEPDFSTVGNRFNSDGGSFLRGVDRQDTLNSLSSFRQTYKESSAVEYNLSPQGSLPVITALVDAEGNRLVPDEDLDSYFQEVDLEDDFFKTLDVQVKVNADYERLGLYDVQIQMEYADEAPRELSFDAQDSTSKTYRAYLAKNSEGEPIHDYQYAYEINYRGSSQKFRSSKQSTNETILTIGVDDVGLLLIDGYAQGIDFRYVDRAQVSIRYSDPERNIQINERQFIVDAAHPEFEIKEPIFVPREQPFEYKVRYFMADGSEFEEGWQPYQSREFYLNDPFTGYLDYRIQAIGAFSGIDAIFLDLAYTENGTAYHQTKKLTFNSQNSLLDWRIPTIQPDQRQLTYSGFIQYSNGSIEEIPQQVTQDTTIRVGKIREDVLEVNVSAENIDFEHRIKSAEVTLLYEDTARGVRKKSSFSFREEDDEDWTVDLKDKDRREYQWQAVVTMADRRFGDRGKVYLPGPTKADWGSAATTEFFLADYLPSNEALAEQHNLLLVNISTEDLPWGEDREDEVEKITVDVEYGNKRESFRMDQEDAEEDGPVRHFLVPLDPEAIAARVYRWRVEFRTGDGKLYYPGPSEDEWAQSQEQTIHLSDVFEDALQG